MAGTTPALIGGEAYAMSVLLVSALDDAEARGPAGLDVPIMAGGEPGLDACGTLGQVVGLDPNGDGDLSVRGGPGGPPHREIDRAYNGQAVAICDERGSWLAVVYAGATSRGLDCGVATPWPVHRPYTGPCEYGRVHRRYIRFVAG